MKMIIVIMNIRNMLIYNMPKFSPFTTAAAKRWAKPSKYFSCGYRLKIKPSVFILRRALYGAAWVKETTGGLEFIRSSTSSQRLSVEQMQDKIFWELQYPPSDFEVIGSIFFIESWVFSHEITFAEKII